MDDTERNQLLDHIANSIGDDAYNRLVASEPETRHLARLRFWQEKLLNQAGLSISTVTEFLELFEKASWRPTGRSRDPLTAATTTFLAPFLSEHGFKKMTGRLFGRVTNGSILQYIDLQLSAYGGKDFAVNYASLLITRLRDQTGSTTFRRLRRGKSEDGWWSAKNHELADGSMLDICSKLIDVALPWFETTATVLGLAGELGTRAGDGNPHTYFELGCCFVTAGDLAAARSPLQEAVRRFGQSYDDIPQRTWALKERNLAQELISAVEGGSHANLLATWREQTIANLKLEKICGRGT